MRVLIISILIFVFPFLSMAQTEGEKLFSTICVACHTIGSGRLVGPDLKDVDKKVSDKWMKAFIKSSQTVVKSGDKTANALFLEYSSIVMPDQPTFTDAQISSIIAYIKSKGTPKETVATTESKSKTDTVPSTSAPSTTPPASPGGNTTASAPAAASNAPATTTETNKTSDNDAFELFSSSSFWIIAGTFIILLFVIFALSKTVIALMHITHKVND